MQNWLRRFKKFLFFSLGVITGLEWAGFFKPSIRSRVIYGLIRLIYRRRVTTDIIRQRDYLDDLQKLVPPPLKLEPQPVDAGGVPAEWVLPQEDISNQVVFYLHGGAYVTKMPVLHRNFLHRLAQLSKAQFLMVDYRLAPEFPYPAALQDSLTAYKWLLDQGYAPQQIVVAGDSAGGGLCLATMLAAKEQGLPMPASMILMSPWTDLVGTGDSLKRLAEEDVLLSWENLKECAEDYAGKEDRYHPFISPLFGDFHGLPNTFILVGGQEILLDDSSRLALRIEQAGVRVEFLLEPYMGHVFPAYAPSIPESEKAVRQIADFIRKS